jgi:hypothetical protein
MLNEILDRINSRLEVLKLAPSAASHMAGLSKDAIRNIERAVEQGKLEGGTSTVTLLKLAPVLRTTASWLLEGTGVEDTSEPDISSEAQPLWDACRKATTAPLLIQQRIIHFIEFELDRLPKSST